MLWLLCERRCKLDNRSRSDLDKASPLRGTATASAAIDQDTKALQAGSPDMRNLQKLTLFATSHPITSGEEEEDDKKIWDEARLFDRVLDGLLGFLQPDKVSNPGWLLPDVVGPFHIDDSLSTYLSKDSCCSGNWSNINTYYLRGKR
jgi:hypothetical protein